MRRTNRAVLGGLAAFALSAAVFGAVPQAAKGRVTSNPGTAAFGRRWWFAVSEDRGQGFLNGYADCGAAAKGPRLPGNDPISDLSSRITAYYEAHPKSREPVVPLAVKIDRNVRPQRRRPGDEVWTNPHGYYDGLWWNGAGQQIGYVQGYLACLGWTIHAREAGHLAAAITDWYQRHPKKKDRPIAEILESLIKGRAVHGGAAEPNKPAAAAPSHPHRGFQPA